VAPDEKESQNLPPKAYCPQPSKRVRCLPYSVNLSAAATHPYREDTSPINTPKISKRRNVRSNGKITIKV